MQWDCKGDSGRLHQDIDVGAPSAAKVTVTQGSEGVAAADAVVPVVIVLLIVTPAKVTL